MNVLFLTLGVMDNINTHGIYTDLLREFQRNGHNTYVVSTHERKYGLPTSLRRENGVTVLQVRTGNIRECNFFEKGLTTLTINQVYYHAIKKYIGDVSFDMIMYSTPPITFCDIIKKLNPNHSAFNYLILKDIFPQNAIDIGILSKQGLRGMVYRYFLRKEKALYQISDGIGCSSPANQQYLMDKYHYIQKNKLSICYNSLSIRDMSVSNEKRIALREKYGIPNDKIVLLYGGNLGKPQGIPFLIECLKTQRNNDQVYFLIIGDGTEYSVIEKYIMESQQGNVKLLKRLPKHEYDSMVASCDVGMVFLDYRFTVPNFPSRLLPYMEAKLPVLACTDESSDIGDAIIEGQFGWWCKSNDVSAFSNAVCAVCNSDLSTYKTNAWEYLNRHFDVHTSYMTIMEEYHKWKKNESR